MKIVFLPEVLNDFNDLITILYKKEYFGFEESAIAYVDDLIDDIKYSLPSKLSKKAPSIFERYGKDMQYAIFKKNRNTQWYVFYNIYKQNNELIYLVRYISNNHVLAQHFKRS